MPAQHAVLGEDERGRSVLRFERLLGHPPERVWRALTELGALADWHPTPFALVDAAVGGEIRYAAAEGMPQLPPGRVLAYEPFVLLTYTWGEDELRWSLAERADGCLLRLEHAFEDRFKAARDGAGWHLCLLALQTGIDGAPAPKRGHGERLPAGWSELNEEYQQRFEISPDEATPPPPR
jgi:uncharacterized protein YndB with AHSA1/START domain